MKYEAIFKTNAINNYYASGKNYKVAAKKVDISEKTLKKWVYEFEKSIKEKTFK
ncbi:helix-turn-helix domain-containing protein [Alloiococcus sp. CFN-8]|uniref:helix-turn-helix domain-containing protein n=1 Tax=Alloiococcus sp. CFN-8 TaxID=3416081 RepID=UPI003CF4D892